MKVLNKFQLQDQLPIPPMSLETLINDEYFDLIEIESDVLDEPYQIWSLELNTNQDQMTIKIEPSSEIDGSTEYKVDIKLNRNRKGRFTTGKSLFSLNEIQVVRYILENFDKYGQCGNQYNQYWEV